MREAPRVKISAIPTTYRGVRFRSRTEARWAVFLDEIGWPWEYEIRDLGGYIPDFVLRFDDAPMVLEVKGDALTLGELGQHAGKIERSGWDGEILIVGAAPWELRSAQPMLGWFGEPESIQGEREWTWGDARLFRCLSCNHVSVLAASGSWRCRICGTGSGNEHVGSLNTSDDADQLSRIWVRAGNRVQWRPET